MLGYPVVIGHSKYQRNEFIFNFGLLVDADGDNTPYERVVRCLASTFAEMEKQNEFLSLSEDGRHHMKDSRLTRRSIEGLLEIIKEDLNNYGECMIPVGTYTCILFILFLRTKLTVLKTRQILST